MTSLCSLKLRLNRPRAARTVCLHAVAVSCLALAACEHAAPLPPEAGTGSTPTLPEPHRQWIPTVQIAKARGWPSGGQPTPAPGLKVQAYARDLSHPRWLLTLPNGDVLVAETNAPPKPDDARGLKGWVMKLVMKSAGAGGASPNRITLLRDTDGDGVADTRSVFLSGLNSPFGMALIGDKFYVADTDAVLRFTYQTGQTSINVPGEKIIDLPAGRINHHWTKNLIASLDGKKLYVTVGSNSNVAENGIEQEDGRASIWEIDLSSGSHRIFATGLRNPNGLGWEPNSHALWTVVNERDEIGDDLVPDYLTSVKDGAFYGWPYSYYGQHVDPRVSPPRPDMVSKAIAPDYALGSHVAPLGMVFSDGNRLPAIYRHGVFVGEHGSWNRSIRNGYKVVFVPFEGASPAGPPLDVLTGFVSAEGEALGRPVGTALDKTGALLVADDVGNVVWRVSGD